MERGKESERRECGRRELREGDRRTEIQTIIGKGKRQSGRGRESVYRRRELRVRGRETEDSATKRNYNIHEREGQTKRQWAVGGQTDTQTETETVKDSCGRVSSFYRS